MQELQIDDIFVVGNNNTHQLGPEFKEDSGIKFVPKLTRLNVERQSSIKEIFFGSSLNFILYHNGKVAAIGHPEEYEDGTGDQQQHQGTTFSISNVERVTKIQGFAGATFFLRDDEKFYLCGGFWKPAVKKNILISKLPLFKPNGEEKVISICTFTPKDSFLFLTNLGNLFILYYTLKMEPFTNLKVETTHRVVQMEKMGDWPAEYDIVFLTDKGDVYIGTTLLCRNLVIEKLHVGFDFMILESASRDVHGTKEYYISGSNKVYQLSYFTSNKCESQVARVDPKYTTQLKQISTGSFHTLVLLSNNHIVSFGFNRCNQCGIDDSIFTTQTQQQTRFMQPPHNLIDYFPLRRHYSLYNIEIKAGKMSSIFIFRRSKEAWNIGNLFKTQCFFDISVSCT